MDLILRNANVWKYNGLTDIGIENGKFKKIKKEISEKGEEEIDLKGKLVTPPLVEIHVHMDAVLTVGEPRFNMTGTLLEGIEIWSERKKKLTREDVKERVIEAVKWQLANGVTRIRTHVDVCDPSFTALKAILEVKKEFDGLVEIQTVAFPQEGIYSYPDGDELVR
ncbi:MAG: cytosine deaminase, partial [Methanomicrobia archaeon]|nr:cytosine deaminase [Methanomicrobia archaeon]